MLSYLQYLTSALQTHQQWILMSCGTSKQKQAETKEWLFFPKREYLSVHHRSPTGKEHSSHGSSAVLAGRAICGLRLKLAKNK